MHDGTIMVNLGRTFREAALTRVSGVGLRGKNTRVSGLVNFQMPNRNPKGDIKQAVKYVRSRLENKGQR